jgi:hypothetical protein
MRLTRIAAQYRLTLAGFEPRILLVDHVDAALAADDAAVLVTLLERTERITDLHDTRLLAKIGLKGRYPGRRGNYARPSPLSTREIPEKMAVFRQKSPEPVYP